MRSAVVPSQKGKGSRRAVRPALGTLATGEKGRGSLPFRFRPAGVRATLPEGSIMELSDRELWTVIHGLILGTLFLLAFAGGLAGLWSLRPGMITTEGIKERMRRLYVGVWVMAVTAWLTVITGTWIVYPWYRVKLAPAGNDLYAGCAGAIVPGPSCSPRDFLKSNVSGTTSGWHSLGMEWKEHVSWAAPILATAAAFLVVYYGPRLIARKWLRTAVIVMFVGAFAAAVVGGAFGAFLNKIAPII